MLISNNQSLDYSILGPDEREKVRIQFESHGIGVDPRNVIYPSLEDNVNNQRFVSDNNRQ